MAVSITTSTGKQYDMPDATWDAIGILVRAHYKLMTGMCHPNAKVRMQAGQGAAILTRVIKRIR